MANDARATRKAKDDEANNSDGRNTAGRTSTSSSAATLDASSLRRSARETSSKKNIIPGPLSTRKSERLEKRTPVTPPVKRNSEGADEQSTPSPLRRSERGKNQSSSSSSGSKKSDKSLGSSVMKKKLKKEKSVKQLTLETEEVSKSEKEVTKPVQAEKKRMHARDYRALFKPQAKKVNAAGHLEDLNESDKLSQGCGGNHGHAASRNVDGDDECCQKKVEKLRTVYDGGDLEKTLEESNFSASKPAKETLEDNVGLESSHSSQKCESGEEARQSEDGHGMKDSRIGDCALLSSPKTISKHPNDVAERAQENLQPELVNRLLINRTPDGHTVLDSNYELVPSKRKRDVAVMDSDTTAVVSSKDSCTSVADFIASSHQCRTNFIVETCAACSKRRRVCDDSKQQELCSCKSKLNQDLCGISEAKDAVEIEAGISAGLAEQCICHLQCKESSEGFQLDGYQNTCHICKLGGKLLCCDGLGCKRTYHISCLGLSLKDVSFGVWHCFTCVRKKIELGVHSVSQGVESIWDMREAEISDGNGLQRQKQFFVKYKGLAHVHNRWVLEDQLLLEASSLVAKFNQEDQVTRWKEEWTVPRRLLQKRLLMSPEQRDEYFRGHSDDILDCHYEWLVKWCGLDYEHATWELENADFMNLPEAQSLMKDYENRLEKAKRVHCLSQTEKKLEMKKLPSVKLSQLPAGLDKNHLDFVNNLCEHWHKGQNAVVIDDQERMMKVISFILSVSSNVSCPFLIITTSAVVHSWDEEFLRLASTVDVVVYHGNKDMRKSIRTVECFENGDYVMFQILVTSPEIIIEDLDVFKSIKWEAIVVDECQCSSIYSYFEQIKLLGTDVRLLLVNGQFKDGIMVHLLSVLDCQSDSNGGQGFVTNSSHKIGNLRERLSKYIANGCKLDSSRFIEYWVPAEISNMQLEQYCASLLSNYLSLCSSSKSDPVGVLRDILVSIRKCCDHPYIIDPSLQVLLTKDGKEVDILDVGIKASGKLQLLDAMLFEIRNRGYKVLILFQSSRGSGKENIGLGDILDDFVRQRFGKDSYERVDGILNPTKKQAAVQNFNNEKGRFVFLLETRGCSPMIKLSSVDTIIIYGSDWSPVNDLKNLQKITLDSQHEHINVFRLYSSYTVEEKVLILARQDKTLDSNLQNTNPATSHMLLIWGVSYLFNKLDEFHSDNNVASNESSLLEKSLLKDVIQEFSTILLQNGRDNIAVNSSIILRVKQNQGSYSANFPLPGEGQIKLVDEEPPHIFWKTLLEGKQPQWKYSSGTSQRNRKRVQYFDDSSKQPEEGDEVVKKRKKLANNSIGPPSLKPGTVEGNVIAGDKDGTFGRRMHNPFQTLPRSNGHLNTIDANLASTSPYFSNNILEVPEVSMDKFNERVNLRESQKSLHLLLRPEISKLCKILHLSEDVKVMAESFLRYVMDNHHVTKEPATILQAFQISLCWTAASLLKYKLDHKESLALAKQHLNFGCRKEEADYVYSMLRCLKKMFLHHTGNLEMACSPEASQLSTKDLSHDHLHTSPSQLMLSSLKKVKVEVELPKPSQAFSDDQVLSCLGLAQQDYSKSIKDIEKKCNKQMRRLAQKQQEEKEQVDEKYKEEKAQLENKQRTEVAVIRLHGNSSMRTDRLKLLDIEYANKFEELNHQKEICLKDLEAVQLAARKKLQERKAQWVEGVKSWAQVELINKQPTNGTEHNKKAWIPVRAQCMPDGEAQPEVTETISSNDDEENILPGVCPASEQIDDGTTLHMLDGDIPLRMTNTVILRDGSENVVSLNTPSSEEQIPVVEVPLEVPEAISSSDGPESIVHKHSPKGGSLDGVALTLPNREFTLRVPEVVSSSGRLLGIASVNPSPCHEQTSGGPASCMHGSKVLLGLTETSSPETLEDSNTTGKKGIYDMASNASGKVPSGVLEPATGEVMEGGQTGEQQGGKIMADKSISNQEFQSSDKEAVDNQRDMEIPSGVPETAPGALEGDVETGKGWDAKVQTGETVVNEENILYDNTAVDIPRDREVPLGVPGTALCEVVEGGSSGRENDVACVMASVDQQGRVFPLGVSRTVVRDGNTGREIGVHAMASGTRTQVDQQDGMVCIINQEDHSLDPSYINSPSIQPVTALPQGRPEQLNQVYQDQCPQMTASTRLQDRAAPARENHDGLQQVETPVAHPDDVLAPDPSYTDAPVVDHVLQSQLLPTTDTPSGLDTMDLPSASRIELQPSHEGDTANNITQSLLQLVENHMELSNQADLQPVTHVSDTRSMPTSSGIGDHPVQTAPPVRMPLPLYHDPLQNELERIRKETDLTINIHEEAKLQLKSDCEKEIEDVVAQIRRKYETKLQVMETEFVCKKKELDANHNKVLMNKILAEAFRSKCMDIRANSAPGMHPDLNSSFMQQLFQLSSQPTGPRPSIFGGPSSAGSAGCSATTVALAPRAATSQSPALPIKAVHQALFSGTPTRLPHISSNSPTTGNPQVGSEIRAPAPHLQRFRPSVSMTPTNLSSLSHGMSCQPLSSNPPTTSPALSPIPLRMPASTHQPGPHNRASRPETAEILLPLPSSSPSALELLIDVNHTSTNQLPPSISPPLTDLGSNSDPRVPLCPPNSMHANPVCPSELVCLSDDD